MKKSRLGNFRLWATCSLIVLTFSRNGQAKPPANAVPLDLRSYAVEISRCSVAIASLRQNPAGMEDFRRSLPAEWDVRSGNETFRVSTAWLDSALEQMEKQPETAPAKWRQIEDRLEFLRRQAEALALPEAAPSAAAAREQLDGIFRRREFRGLAGPSALQLLWRRLVAWIDEGIAWLMARLHLGALSGNAVAYGLIAIALLFFSFWGWRSLAGRMRQEEQLYASGKSAEGGKEWVRDALAAADRGEFREAIRCAYWAAVARLEEQGVFSPDHSRTPRELLRLIADGANGAPFRQLTESFELAWYGYRPASLADWQNTKAQMERIGCLGFSTPQTASS